MEHQEHKDNRDITESDLDSRNIPIYYPPKPKKEVQKPRTINSIISLAVFILLGFILFDWDFHNLIVLIGVLLIHEFGHYIAMQQFDYSNLNIFFIPLLGAATTGTKEQTSQLQKIIILFAGPIPGIIIGILFLIYAPWYKDIAIVFIGINLFNLFPILPLDGGRIMETLFTSKSTIINGLFLGISALTLAAISIYIQQYVLLVVPLLMFLRLSNELKVTKTRSEILKTHINLKQSYNKLSDREYYLIFKSLLKHNSQFAKFMKDDNISEERKALNSIQNVENVLLENAIEDISLLGKLGVLIFWLFAMITPLYVWLG